MRFHLKDHSEVYGRFQRYTDSLLVLRDTTVRRAEIVRVDIWQRSAPWQFAVVALLATAAGFAVAERGALDAENLAISAGIVISVGLIAYLLTSGSWH